MEKSKDLAILILAAGSSKRLGEAKQLLKYKGKSLIQIAIKNALEISNSVYVVLGYKKEESLEEIKDLNVNTIYNKEYEKGIGSSISCGVKNLKEYKNIMIILCDQPFIPLSHLQSLKKSINNQNIIASKYSQLNESTVPAIFPNKYFNQLIELNEDKGAKKILKQNRCINIYLEKKNSIDIDTKEDVVRLFSFT